MKKFLKVLGITVISLVGITFLGNLMVKSLVTTVASRITGAPIHMDGFSLDILRSTVRISGFTMYNPSGFPDGILISCPHIKIIFDRATLFRQKRHLLVVEIELKELGLTTNKDGKLNVDSLKIGQQADAAPPIPMQIDLLTLSIGKVVFKDYTNGAEPSVQVYTINKHKTYKGIPTAQQLILLMLAEPMKAASVKYAGIYGAALLTGVAALPAALPAVVAGTFIGKDHVKQVVEASFEQVYQTSLEVVARMGRITKQEASNGVVKANIHGAMVAIILRKRADHTIEITISARKLLFPKLDIAGGVLYQILDKLE